MFLRGCTCLQVGHAQMAVDVLACTALTGALQCGYAKLEAAVTGRSLPLYVSGSIGFSG